MTLQPGARVGPYEVQYALGAGGMGEVYRARDAALNRDVALKILPEIFALDRDRLARFRREAQLLAALNHPNVAAIYGFEESVASPGAVQALVLELIEGPTLADRLASGAIPIDEALALARQIVEALEAAHEKGIIHRDLKPANIKITPDGVVKVLDFGLAKATSGESSGPMPTVSTNLAAAQTYEGVVMGTAAYMSPEQARGRAMDKRTDIWAFGCVVYEMLTARMAFAGETQPDTMAAVLEREPDWSALPEATPASVRRLLKRCLEKDARRRLRDIGDARLELEASSGAADPSASLPGSRERRRLRVAVGVLGALLAVGVGSLALLLRRDTPPVAGPESVRRFSIQLDEVRPSISPDGRHIAYRSGGRLWIRDLSSETPREIPDGKAAGGFYSDAGYYLAWSPDSRDLVFPAEGELKKVSVQDGSAMTICKLPPGRMTGRHVAGIAWSSDGKTIVFSRYGAGIYEVPAGAGSPTLLWKEEHADDVIALDTPEGRAVVYAIPGVGGHTLVARAPSGERRVLAELDTAWPELVYSPSGHILFRRNPVQSPSIWALPFSVRTQTTEGEAFLVERSGQGVSLSQDGTLVYLDAGRIQRQRLAWRDRSGKVVNQSEQGHETIETVALSPDRNRAIVTANDGQSGLWIYDLQRLVRTRFEFGSAARDMLPLNAFWSKAGDRIYYTVLKSEQQTLVFSKPADGFGAEHAVEAPEGFKVAVDGTADGRYLVLLYRPSPEATINIWLVRNDTGSEKSEGIHFSQNSASEQGLALSPTGRHLAYTSTISGRLEIYVRPFPEGRGRWQVSVSGGEAPAWGPDEKELFFKEGNTLMRVSVSTAGEFSAGAAEPLFEHPGLRIVPAPGARYAVSRDGLRFLTVESERSLTTPVVRVVENWLPEFQRATSRPVTPASPGGTQAR
jgi:serine/threonine protein kinase/Tol biopolymer transport system component